MHPGVALHQDKEQKSKDKRTIDARLHIEFNLSVLLMVHQGLFALDPLVVDPLT